MKITSLHGDGRPHRCWPEAMCTDDPWVFYVPPGSPVVEADGRRWTDEDPVLLMFWPGAFYQVCLLLRPYGTDYYCNIITPPVYQSDAGVYFRDLDIDVLLMKGELRVVDEEEFRIRSRRYPAAWVEAAQAARDWLTAAARTQSGPFTPAIASRWRAWVERRGQGRGD
ncbi:DUF402 domain-containing protein [Alicyclobacillus shizuokensis]|uniref:DUF402 domain-containing protein n=1 Tax=Alicyclobacillus shizuokensis TaxID=392014 RepID=UPI000AAF765D|nr:DUF402 domain-containing protein [Alicyclobacillus shizuokensis]MCL6626842.1 DUF402 domain-containing protein [Alicyclobacillus shizuokensis]